MGRVRRAWKAALAFLAAAMIPLALASCTDTPDQPPKTESRPKTEQPAKKTEHPSKGEHPSGTEHPTK